MEHTLPRAPMNDSGTGYIGPEHTHPCSSPGTRLAGMRVLNVELEDLISSLSLLITVGWF